MKRSNLLAAVILFSLGGCSSAPPPVAVEWEKKAETVNSQIPVWQPNSAVVPSENVTGNWSYVLSDFSGDDGNYPVAFYFGVTHSQKVVVVAPDAAAFYSAKFWLREHGAKGVISFQSKGSALTRSTSIYLYR